MLIRLANAAAITWATTLAEEDALAFMTRNRIEWLRLGRTDRLCLLSALKMQTQEMHCRDETKNKVP